MPPRLFPAAVLAALLILLPASAQAADKFETYKVPSVDGSTINVEVARPDDKGPVPILLTYSPYHTLDDALAMGNPIAADSLYEEYKDKGYARAKADVIGTRGSTGCWDYGGAKEIQSGVDVVNFLAKQPWSNGKVGMIGGSYDGTTANMVAAQGDKAPGLAGIVPQAAISRWYGYAYQDGVRYFGNSQEPADEGFDTPLLFDFGFGRTVSPEISPAMADLVRARLNECDATLHTEKGYDRTPDYDAFWLERDYRKDADNVKVPVLVTHGLQDYNVKQSEGVDFYEALPEGGPFKKLFIYQGAHGTPGHAEYTKLVERFFARTLKGVANGIENEPAVWTEGRNGTAQVKLKKEAAWPPPGTKALTLDLGRGEESGVLGAGTPGEDTFTDRSNNSEELAMESPDSEEQWLYYVSAPLKENVRIAGSAVLDAMLETSAAGGQVDPTLLDVAPDGSMTPITRGHLNLAYRNSLAKADPPPPDAPIRARARMAPQDQTIPKGHSIGLIVAGSNVAWALPDDPNTTFTYLRGGQSRLVLPVVGPAPDAVPGGRIGGPVTGSNVGAVLGGAPPTPAAPKRSSSRRLSLHIWRLRRNRLRIYGKAKPRQRLTLRIRSKGRRAKVRRLRIRTKTGSFRVTVKNVPRRRGVRVVASVGKLKVTRRLTSRQIGNKPD